MANPNDPLFSVDAEEILVKLHLAGKSQVTLGYIVNTGIKNDSEGARDPENPGKLEFDLGNPDGMYEVCGFSPNMRYQIPVDITKRKEILKAREEVEAKQAKLKKSKPASTTTTESMLFSEGHESSSLLTDEDATDPEKPGEDKDSGPKKPGEKEGSEDPSKKDGSGDDGKGKEKESSPEQKEYDAAMAKYKDALLTILFSSPEAKKMASDNKKAAKEALESDSFKTLEKEEKDLTPDEIQVLNILAAISIENTFRAEEKNKQLKEVKKQVMENSVGPYMVQFAGKENAAKVKKIDLAFGILGLDKGQYKSASQIEKIVKNYKLESASEDELKKAEEKIQTSSKPDDFVEPAIYFKFAYELEVETM